MEETILQFGTGRFLRSFTDLFVHESNAAGSVVGRVVALQSTDSGRAEQLNQQGGRYHVLIRGERGVETVDEVLVVGSISRALTAAEEWHEVLDLGRSPGLRTIVSNVTEVGYRLKEMDEYVRVPPASFPAKLTALLHTRYSAGHDGVTILPCELIERNGDRLFGLIVEVAERWQLARGFIDWLRERCLWANCLVDRIVTGAPAQHELLSSDQLLSVAEPFAFWAIEMPGDARCPIEHESIHCVESVDPYALRKVRILNGAHTAMALKAMSMGFETVRQCVSDGGIGSWLEELLIDEIVPVLEDRVPADELRPFVHETLDRFCNPFIEHELKTISWEQTAKVETRLLPSYREYRERFHTDPPLLSSLIEAAGIRTDG